MGALVTTARSSTRPAAGPPPARPGANAEFADLFGAYAPRLRGVAKRRIADAHLAEDVVQETMLRAYRAGIHRQPERDPWPWLVTVAYRLCCDAHRAAHRVRPLGPVAVVGGPDPEAAVMAGARRRLVSATLDELDPRQRRLLSMRYLGDASCWEIARRERTTVGAVKSALARARVAFRARYDETRRLVPALVLALGERLRAARAAASGHASTLRGLLRAAPHALGVAAAGVATAAVLVSSSLHLDAPGAGDSPIPDPPREASARGGAGGGLGGEPAGAVLPPPSHSEAGEPDQPARQAEVQGNDSLGGLSGATGGGGPPLPGPTSGVDTVEAAIESLDPLGVSAALAGSVTDQLDAAVASVSGAVASVSGAVAP